MAGELHTDGINTALVILGAAGIVIPAFARFRITPIIGFILVGILVGPMDRVETAWQERNLLHLELPRFMAVIAFLLMLISFQLAWSRPQEPNFRLLGFNA